MNICVLDVETTFQIGEKGKTDPTPYNPENDLVSVGTLFTTGLEDKDDNRYIFFNHNECSPTDGGSIILQKSLDKADLIVWHNGKFDRSWLRTCGFSVPDACWDTMIVEYVLQCGLKAPLSLAACCERYDLTRKKTDLTEDYLKRGIGFEAMPWEVVKEYGIGDLVSTAELFWKQFELLGFENVSDAIPSITAHS